MKGLLFTLLLGAAPSCMAFLRGLHPSSRATGFFSRARAARVRVNAAYALYNDTNYSFNFNEQPTGTSGPCPTQKVEEDLMMKATSCVHRQTSGQDHAGRWWPRRSRTPDGGCGAGPRVFSPRHRRPAYLARDPEVGRQARCLREVISYASPDHHSVAYRSHPLHHLLYRSSRVALPSVVVMAAW